MTEKPLISVIMPVYNCEKYLPAAIGSIISQTYSNWELLICDDGSTDRSLEIIQKFAVEDKRLKWFVNSTNQRLLKTRNRLLKTASGRLITFQDADDYSDSCRLEKMVREFQSKPHLGLLSSQIGYINARGNLLRVSLKPNTYSETLSLIYHHNVVGGSNMMIKKEVLDSVGGQFRTYFDGLSYQDYDLSFLIAERFECYNLPDVLYFYRQHGASASKIISIERLLARQIVIHLGMQRKARGYDDLQAGQPDQVDLFFESLKIPYRKDKSRIFRDYAADFMYNKLYIRAFVASIHAIIAGPSTIENYRTLLYCLRRSLMN